MKRVFVLPERCIGCLQCEYACAVAHSQSQDPIQALFEEPPPVRRIHVEPGPRPNSSFPNKCRHCNPAPCQQVCPTGAIYRDPDFDVVLINPDRCIACALCAIACPFDVITYHPVSNGLPAHIAAVKCDECITRQKEGKEPACVEVCKVDALIFGEINELVRSGRLKETAAVLTAVESVQPAAPREPENVAAWRAWTPPVVS